LCKDFGAGVVAELQNRNKTRKELASKLTVGDWVLFDAGDDETEPIWLGRVVSNPSWDGHGVSQNNTSGMVSYSN